jgi:hypothetical protein
MSIDTLIIKFSIIWSKIYSVMYKLNYIND